MNYKEKLIEFLRDAFNSRPLYGGYSYLADCLIESGVTVQKWFSVAEPPNKDEDVLCSRGDHIGAMMDVYTYAGDHYWEDSYGYLCREEDEGITHWMYLPCPPKGE
jgi:hypothetical protein